jgi:hypothetical protein
LRRSFEGNSSLNNSNTFDSDNETARPAYTSVFWSSSPIETSKPDRIIQSGQKTDTTSNNRVQILDAIESKPRNLRDWTALTLAAPVSHPPQHPESTTILPTLEPLLPSDRIIIAAPTAKHTGLRGSNNYRFPCKYRPSFRTSYYHPIG